MVFPGVRSTTTGRFGVDDDLAGVVVVVDWLLCRLPAEFVSVVWSFGDVALPARVGVCSKALVAALAETSELPDRLGSIILSNGF